MDDMSNIQRKALEKAMWNQGHTNNDVTRYTADAVAEYDQLRSDNAALRAENEQLKAFCDKWIGEETEWQESQPLIESLRADKAALKKEIEVVVEEHQEAYNELQTNHRLTVNAGADAIRQLKGEVERLTKIRDGYATSARTIALYLEDYCNGALPYPEMIAEESRKASAEISRLQSDNDRMARELEAAVATIKNASKNCNHWDCAVKEYSGPKGSKK